MKVAFRPEPSFGEVGLEKWWSGYGRPVVIYIPLQRYLRENEIHNMWRASYHLYEVLFNDNDDDDDEDDASDHDDNDTYAWNIMSVQKNVLACNRSGDSDSPIVLTLLFRVILQPVAWGLWYCTANSMSLWHPSSGSDKLIRIICPPTPPDNTMQCLSVLPHGWSVAFLFALLGMKSSSLPSRNTWGGRGSLYLQRKERLQADCVDAKSGWHPTAEKGVKQETGLEVCAYVCGHHGEAVWV